MIDTKELREKITIKGLDVVADTDILVVLDRLEAAEKSDAESLAMYRKARDERDALRVELNEIRYWTAVAHDTIKALNARIEAAENDAAHQKALAASALRVAEGWERKCGELRAKIEQMEKRLRLILEEPENTMSNSKALREMVRQARLALEESK